MSQLVLDLHESQRSTLPDQPFSSQPLPDFIPLADTADYGIDTTPKNPLAFHVSKKEPQSKTNLQNTAQTSESQVHLPHPLFGSDQASSQFTRPALQELADSLDYTIDCVSGRNRRIILTEALAFLNITLRGGSSVKLITNQQPSEITSQIRQMIPTAYLKMYGLSQVQGNSSDLWFREGSIMRATARYIVDLKKEAVEEKIGTGYISALGAGPDQSQSAIDSSSVVETTLRKIDSWCTEWLEGKHASEDWNKMEDRLCS